jgi:hypothetical protein
LHKILKNRQNNLLENGQEEQPIIIVYDEAQTFVPLKDDEKNSLMECSKEGKQYNLGLILNTTQPSGMPENLLNRNDNWFVFHMSRETDLQAVKKGNAYFSQDVLTSILNESLPGYVHFWSAKERKNYPLHIKTVCFDDEHKIADPDFDKPAVDCYASELSRDKKKDFPPEPERGEEDYELYQEIEESDRKAEKIFNSCKMLFADLEDEIIIELDEFAEKLKEAFKFRNYNDRLLKSKTREKAKELLLKKYRPSNLIFTWDRNTNKPYVQHKERGSRLKTLPFTENIKD